MKLAYYPGCSLHGTGREYDMSVKSVARELGIELEEVPDWNCCGASSAHNLDQDLSLFLPARNQKLVEEQKLDVLVPCAACFLRAKTCSHIIKNDQNTRERIEKKINYKFNSNTAVFHPMEFLVKNIGLDEIRKHVKKSLNGLRVVCYYGCLLVRPHDITQLDDKENPQMLDQLMQAAGADPVDWPYKTECCGAALSLSRSGLVTKLVGKMAACAEESGAKAIVTACPLCQSNMEMRQSAGKKIPVFYFTELLGIAFGLEDLRPVLGKHLIDTKTVVDSIR